MLPWYSVDQGPVRSEISGLGGSAVGTYTWMQDPGCSLNKICRHARQVDGCLGLPFPSSRPKASVCSSW